MREPGTHTHINYIKEKHDTDYNNAKTLIIPFCNMVTKFGITARSMKSNALLNPTTRVNK